MPQQLLIGTHTDQQEKDKKEQWEYTYQHSPQSHANLRHEHLRFSSARSKAVCSL